MRAAALTALLLAALPKYRAEATGPAGAVYLRCESGANRGHWLSFTGLELKFYSPSSLSGRAPFLFMRAGGGAGQFNMQNLWRGYSEPRYADFVTVNADQTLGLVPSTDTGARAMFTIVPTTSPRVEGHFFLEVVRAGKQASDDKVWVGPGSASASTDVELVSQASRVSWSFVAAPDAMLPPSGPPAFLQIESGLPKGDWVGFTGTPVCGRCANRGATGGVGLDTSK